MARLHETGLTEQTPFIKAEQLAQETSPFSIHGATKSQGQFGMQIRFQVTMFDGVERILTLQDSEQRARFVDYFTRGGNPIENLKLEQVKTAKGNPVWVFTDFDGEETPELEPF